MSIVYNQRLEYLMSVHQSNPAPIVPQAQPFLLAGGSAGIVIVHGYGGSIGDYHVIADKLHNLGYTVAGVRLAGHGQDQVALRQATVPDMQASVATAIQEIRQHCQHVIILGSSYGGVLALDYAAHHDVVDGLVLVNTALSYSGAGIFQGIILRLMRLFTPDYRKKNLSIEEQQEGKAVGSASAWPINGILATSKFAKKEVIQKLPTIHAPTLIFHSQHDPVVGTKNSQKLSTLLGSVRKETFTLPDTTHRPFRNAQANAFMAEHAHQFIQSVIASA